MSAKPTARELHDAHAWESLSVRRLARVRNHEAEVRRLAEERWQRRILPLLSNDEPLETDFPGCTG